MKKILCLCLFLMSSIYAGAEDILSDEIDKPAATDASEVGGVDYPFFMQHGLDRLIKKNDLKFAKINLKKDLDLLVSDVSPIIGEGEYGKYKMALISFAENNNAEDLYSILVYQDKHIQVVAERGIELDRKKGILKIISAENPSMESDRAEVKPELMAVYNMAWGKTKPHLYTLKQLIQKNSKK